MSSWVRHVDDEAGFSEHVIERSHAVFVLVDFWAGWCAPCRMLTPILERVVDEAGGRLELAKVDTERCEPLASRHGVSAIPAVRLFHRGEQIAEFTGAQDVHFVRGFIAEHLPARDPS